MSKKITSPITQADRIVVFQETAIRRAWHESEWWFSVSDVCEVLTNSPDVGAYWRKLKQWLNAEGSEVVTFCHGLKLEAPDGKQRGIDCHIACGNSLATYNAEKCKGEKIWNMLTSLHGKLILFLRRNRRRCWISSRFSR